ncbi:glycosyl hydrolase family 18 protein [Glutamicibacter sp. X7]
MANVWCWVGLSWTERIRMVLQEFGDRITDISIFGWSVSADGTLTQTFDPALLDQYREKWPHIRFWGCFRNLDDPNDGPHAIFEALRDSATARAHLADEVAAKMFGLYPWLHGVDIDMEGGGNFRSADSEEIFRIVSDRAHALGKKSSGALPALTATGSVGGENWVRYKQLGEILDHVSVMSYDFAWSGSAPGPVSPGFWLEQVYDWAASQITPSKISMGLPLYSYFWQIYDYPSNLGETRRGVSGTYYAAWQYFTGARAWSDSGTHHPIGWICYREPSSKSIWGFLDVYDWLEPTQWAAASGVASGIFQNRKYAVRYGLPAGTPQWSIADNSVGSSHIDYAMNPAMVMSAEGNLVSPKKGFTLTAEIIQRDPVAATIIDDYATSQAQLDQIYTQSGGWKHHDVTDTYRQYRGSDALTFNNNFGSQGLYAMARFQFATVGTFSITSQGITAELTNGGALRLKRGSTVLASKNVGGQIVGGAPQVGRCVLALRVREGSARVYFSNAETSVPLQLEAQTTPPGGPTGYNSTGTAWIDHVYLGDAWWYMPREAIEVEINGQTRVLGRIERTGVTWDAKNRFRPTTDVDERATRTTGIALDWVYAHWKDVPVLPDNDVTVRVRPLDHDLWLGRIHLLDRDGASIVYMTDATTITHWLSRARLDWGLQGIAMWSLGQEDVRAWSAIAGGELTPDTKRLDS